MSGHVSFGVGAEPPEVAPMQHQPVAWVRTRFTLKNSHRYRRHPCHRRPHPYSHRSHAERQDRLHRQLRGQHGDPDHDRHQHRRPADHGQHVRKRVLGHRDHAEWQDRLRRQCQHPGDSDPDHDRHQYRRPDDHGRKQSRSHRDHAEWQDHLHRQPGLGHSDPDLDRDQHRRAADRSRQRPLRDRDCQSHTSAQAPTSPLAPASSPRVLWTPPWSVSRACGKSGPPT